MLSYLAEYTILGLITALVAGLIGIVISWLIVTELMRSEFMISMPAIFLTTAISLLCTISLGLLGTWRALGMKAAPLLRNE